MQDLNNLHFIFGDIVRKPDSLGRAGEELRSAYLAAV